MGFFDDDGYGIVVGWGFDMKFVFCKHKSEFLILKP